MYEPRTDQKGNRFELISSEGEDKIRVTLVQHGWPGGPAIRIQAQAPTGQLFQGPEFAVDRLGEITAAAIRLTVYMGDLQIHRGE